MAVSCVNQLPTSRVKVGEKIGEVGSNSAGVTMLHFEIRVDGKPADPGRFLPHR